MNPIEFSDFSPFWESDKSLRHKSGQLKDHLRVFLSLIYMQHLSYLNKTFFVTNNIPVWCMYNENIVSVRTDWYLRVVVVISVIICNDCKIPTTLTLLLTLYSMYFIGGSRLRKQHWRIALVVVGGGLLQSYPTAQMSSFSCSFRWKLVKY